MYVSNMNFINKACAFKLEERFATLEECLEALKMLQVKYADEQNIPIIPMAGVWEIPGASSIPDSFAPFDADEFALRGRRVEGLSGRSCGPGEHPQPTLTPPRVSLSLDYLPTSEPHPIQRGP